MTKAFFTIGLLLLFCHTSFSQKTLNQTERYNHSRKMTTMKDRYGIDYDLVDASLLGTDSLVLRTINSDLIEQARKEIEDVIIHQEGTGIAIRVYSYEKTALNKQNHH